MTKKFVIHDVTERDIDLLLLEEFHASADFRRWFVERALGPVLPAFEFVGAHRSVSDSTGESDIELILGTKDDGRKILLIENKIGAALQPRQAERYLLRGERYVRRGRCKSFQTIIVAPEQYFRGDGRTWGFGARVLYEDIRAWFESYAALGERRRYKLALLSSALDKSEVGPSPIDEAITNFWQRYWSLANELAPKLEMRRPGSKPSRSTFVSFRPEELGTRLEICHKMDRGFVDLHIPGMGNRLNAIRDKAGDLLAADMAIIQAEKSAAIRICVPKLEPHAAFDEQSANAGEGIMAAKRLFEWSKLAGCKSWVRSRSKAARR